LAPSRGQGAARGSRDGAEDFYLKTRSDGLESTQSNWNTECNNTSNYIQLVAKLNRHLRKYKVDMKPDIDYTGVHKALPYALAKILPTIIFDGIMMFSMIGPTEADPWDERR
jgi:hypothetical protein